MKSPFKMKGFSGFTSNSPLKQDESLKQGMLESTVDEATRLRNQKKASKRKFKKKTVVIEGKTYDKPKKTDVKTSKVDYSTLTDAELEAMRKFF